MGDCGLPGQQPDGQVDEVPPAVDVCRGVLVGGGGTTRRPRRELESASMSKFLVVVNIIELIMLCLV